MRGCGRVGRDLRVDNISFIDSASARIIPGLLRLGCSKSILRTVGGALHLLRNSCTLKVVYASSRGALCYTGGNSPLVVNGNGNRGFVTSSVGPLLTRAGGTVCLRSKRATGVAGSSVAICSGGFTRATGRAGAVRLDGETTDGNSFPRFVLGRVFRRPTIIHRAVGSIAHSNSIILRGVPFASSSVGDVGHVCVINYNSTCRIKLVTGCGFRGVTNIPAFTRCTNRFECRSPIVSRGYLIVVVDRDNRATSDLTTLGRTGRDNTGAVDVIGIPRDSVTGVDSCGLLAGTNTRVTITAAGTFSYRLTVLGVLYLCVTETQGTYARIFDRVTIGVDALLPGGVRHILRGDSSLGTLTTSVGSVGGYFFLKHGTSCKISLRNTLGLGRVDCVSYINYPTDRLGRNAVDLVRGNAIYFNLVDGGSLLPGAISGLVRIVTHNTGMVIFTPRDLGRGLTRFRAIVACPSSVPFLAPFVRIVPLRLLTCCITSTGNLPVSGPHGLTGSIAIRWRGFRDDARGHAQNGPQIHLVLYVIYVGLGGLGGPDHGKHGLFVDPFRRLSCLRLYQCSLTGHFTLLRQL